MNATSPAKQVDYGFVGIVVLVLLIATWLLLMPLVPSIASATLHRFQLASGSFARWAIQFPIPSMYNFANRYEVRQFPGGLADSPIDQRRMVNHFPSRIFTFADGRYMHLRSGEDRWLSVESSYRGQSIRSIYYAEAMESGGFRLHRLPVPENPR